MDESNPAEASLTINMVLGLIKMSGEDGEGSGDDGAGDVEGVEGSGGEELNQVSHKCGLDAWVWNT